MLKTGRGAVASQKLFRGVQANIVRALHCGHPGSSSDADLQQAIQQGYEFKVTLSGATKAYLKNIEAVQFRQASGDGTLLTQWFLRDPVLGVASNGVHAMALTGSAFDNDFDANAQMQMWVTTSNFYKSYAFGGQAPSGSVVDSITGIPLPSTLLPWEPAFSASATASNGAYLRGAGGNDIMRGTNYQDAFVVNTAGSNWIDGRGHEGYRTAQSSPATPTDDTILAAQRGEVADGAHGGEVEEVAQVGVAASGDFLDAVAEFEDEGGGAEVGVAAEGFGVDQGGAGGGAVFGFVMVDDDEVDAAGGEPGGFFVRSGAAVEGDDEGGFAFGEDAV
jgi:hypothetical protein